MAWPKRSPDDNLQHPTMATGQRPLHYLGGSAEDYAKGMCLAMQVCKPQRTVYSEMLAAPADRPIVTYCTPGQTVGQVTAGLNLLGYDAATA